MKLFSFPSHSLPRQERQPAPWLRRFAASAGLLMLLGAPPAMSAPTIAEPAMSASVVRNIVLVHGAFADGSSWSPVITRLQAMGYRVTAVQNPLTSLADDVAATIKVLQRQTGKVLLVGHSWAGVVITQAGNAPNVAGLVYLSALAPDSGESVADLLQRLGAPMSGMAPDAEGLIWLDDPLQYRKVMAADLPLKAVQVLAASQQPIAAAAFDGKVAHAAWRDKPSWYLVTENDHALPPAVQKAIAQQLGATVSSVRSSHMSLLAHPDAVARLIDRAAIAQSK